MADENEYKDWLKEKLIDIDAIYDKIFYLLPEVKDFDDLIKEIGNPLLDLDSVVQGLEEYKTNLKEYLEKQNKKKKNVFTIIGD
jgi:hypothetical protein